MITKQDAAILFAYSFKLVDKEGKEWDIHYPFEQALILIDDKGKTTACFWDKIGTDYWILKRPYSQLKEPIGEDEVIVYNMLWKRSRTDFDEYGENSNFDMWDYEDVKKLHKHHFINLPEGTYLEMD